MIKNTKKTSKITTFKAGRRGPNFFQPFKAEKRGETAEVENRRKWRSAAEMKKTQHAIVVFVEQLIKTRTWFRRFLKTLEEKKNVD